MRKFLIGLGLLVLLTLGLAVAMLATGTIDSSSLRMLLNVMSGVSGPVADEGTVRQRYKVPDGFTLRAVRH